MSRRQFVPTRKPPQRKSRQAALQFHPRAAEPLEERRLLSATSDAPVVEPLVLAGQGEFQVNTVTAGDQLAPSIVNRTDGGFVMGWTDSTRGEIRQRFDAAGAPIGSEIVFGATRQIFSNPAGGFIGLRQSGSNLLARRFDDAGSTIGSEFQVNLAGQSVTAAMSQSALVAYDGSFVVIWNQTVSGQQQLVSRPFDSVDAPLGTPFVIDDTNTNFQAAMNSHGDWVIGYRRLVRVFKSDGSPPFGPIALDTLETDPILQVDINDGGVVLVNYRTVPPTPVVQRFDLAGLPLGEPIDTQSLASTPKAFLQPDGEFVATASFAPSGGSNRDVYVRRFDVAGNPLTGWLLVNSYLTNTQQNPAIAVRDGAEFLVAWQSRLQDGSGEGIYAQRFVDDALATVAAVSTPWGADVLPGSTQVSQLAGLRVAFSRPMTESHITSLANWQLFDEGVDASSLITGVTYENETAILTFSQPLRGDDYELVVSDAIQDTLGRALDGDGNASAGGNFSLAFGVQQHVFGRGPELFISDDDDATVPSVDINALGGFSLAYYGDTLTQPTAARARIFGADGLPITDSFALATGVPTSVLSLGGDEYLGAIASTGGASIQRFSPGSVDTLIQFDNQFPDQIFSNVLVDPDGNLLVVWDLWTQSGGLSDADVFFQRFDPNGVALSGIVPVNSTTLGVQGFSQVAMDAAGNFVITWLSDGQDGDGYGVYAQRFAADGTPQGGEFQVNTHTAGRQIYPSVGMAPNGNFSIVWESEGQDGFNGVYLQRFAADGTPLEMETLLSAFGVDTIEPVIAFDGYGRSIVAWADEVGIMAMAMDANGQPLLAPFQVNTAPAGFTVHSLYPSSIDLAMNASGEAVVAWYAGHPDGSGSSTHIQRLSLGLPPATVTGRHLFYNNSAFDGNDAAANSNDDDAIATDKSAHLPGGGLAAFTSVSSYSRGINGLMIDLDGQHGTPTLDDFTFRRGSTADPINWIDAPLPISLTVRAGTGGADRIELIWPDGALRNTWLEVTMAANFNTGLAAPDVFYFGNKVGDSGTSPSEGFFSTTTTDSLEVFATLGSGKPITDPRDYNRDGKVATTDSLLVFANLGGLKRLDLPGAAQPQVLAQSDSSQSILTAALLAAIAPDVIANPIVDRSSVQAVATALVRAVETIDTPPARKDVLPPRITVAAAPLDQRAVALAFASPEDLLWDDNADDDADADAEFGAVDDTD